MRQVYVVLAISVVYRSCAVPVAWKVLKAEEKHTGKSEWQVLLKRFQGLVSYWVLGKGRRWQGRGIAFKGKNSQLRCTLLGHWGEDHHDPWLVLTDLAPERADACWHGLRAWIEQGFKHCKRSGWQWQHTHMDDPARAERLWMAIAIATWWLLSVGGEAEAQADTPLDIKEPSIPGAVRRRRKRWRIVGIFQHGWSLIMAALLNHHLLPVKPAPGSMAQVAR